MEEVIDKKCNTCGVDKELKEFHKKPRGKHGVESRCKTCRNGEATERMRVFRLKEKSVVTIVVTETPSVVTETPSVVTEKTIKPASVVTPKPSVVTAPSTNNRFERLKRLK